MVRLFSCVRRSIGGSPEAPRGSLRGSRSSPLIGAPALPVTHRLVDDDAEFRDQIRSRRRAQSAPDVGDVVLGRARRDEDRLADLGVGLALQHEPGHIEFPLTQDDVLLVTETDLRGTVSAVHQRADMVEDADAPLAALHLAAPRVERPA